MNPGARWTILGTIFLLALIYGATRPMPCDSPKPLDVCASLHHN